MSAHSPSYADASKCRYCGEVWPCAGSRHPVTSSTGAILFVAADQEIVNSARLAALETVAEAARSAVDALDASPWGEAYELVVELAAALASLGGSPTEDPA